MKITSYYRYLTHISFLQDFTSNWAA